MIEARDGKRYETCVRCGTSWNVATDMEIPQDGYLCPVCRRKMANGETKQNGSANKKTEDE